MAEEFQVLFTAQKQKKNKIWNDGLLKYNPESSKVKATDSQLVLYSSDMVQLES